jgi:hypothetical protein
MVRPSRLAIADRVLWEARSAVSPNVLDKIQFSCTRFLRILVQETTESLGGRHHGTLS